MEHLENEHPFSEYVNPSLSSLLQSLNLDKRYTKGEGCFLYDDSVPLNQSYPKGIKYLDFLAGYGTLPFGYNPPEIWEAILDVYHRKEPGAGDLAKELIQTFGKSQEGYRFVAFANSGAECVEVAFKIARAAKGKQGILSTVNGFHGKTLGALSATGKSLSVTSPFGGAPVENFEKVPFGDLKAMEEKLASGKFAAVILEPLQGEGGAIVPPRGYLKGVREICSRYEVLLILDEVQTGLGRTGTLLASDGPKESIAGDILSKALGGGVASLGAVLYTQQCYSETFALLHSSTFAGNALGTRAGAIDCDN